MHYSPTFIATNQFLINLFLCFKIIVILNKSIFIDKRHQNKGKNSVTWFEYNERSKYGFDESSLQLMP